MKALLFSMPDIYPQWPTHMSKIPNIGLASIAANCPDHEVLVGDLVLKRTNIKKTVRDAIELHAPDVIGLSAMTFQFPTLIKVARYIKKEFPSLPIVIGGYHATILYKEIAGEDSAGLFDFIIRGEGDLSFNELLNALALHGDYSSIRGLSYRRDRQWHHNSARPAEDLVKIKPPNRDSRIWKGYHILCQQGDTLETSRGCLQQCKFCSIKQMYGNGRREYAIDRIMQDIENAKQRGVKHLFFTDDNITSDASGLERFDALLDAIIENKHNDIQYATQVSSIGMGTDERIVKKMRKAGFTIVFLGLENVSPKNLAFYRKGQIVDYTRRAIEYLHRSGIVILGGVVLGAEDDTERDFEINFNFLIGMQVDSLLVQILTPYPGTVLRDELLQKGLITNLNNWERYHGHFANVRTKHLSSEQLDYLVWKYVHKYWSWRSRNLMSMNLFKRYPYFCFKATAIELLKSVPMVLRKFGKDEHSKFRLDFQALANANRNLV